MGSFWSALPAEQDSDQDYQNRHPKSINYAFFHNDKTIHHIQDAKIMFIMRGLPGSGKSTTVASLVKIYPNAMVCSADDYFIIDGEYRFRASLLSRAHESCQAKAEEACRNGSNVIIIDNTNVRLWEMNHYVKLAFNYNYTVIPLEPQTRWRYNPEELAQKTTHGVPLDILKKKVETFETAIPIYYGWFINEYGSSSLVSQGHQHFHEVFEAIPQFASFFQQHFNFTGPAHISDIYPPRGVEEKLHTTTFFAARGREEGSWEYSQRSAVQEALGKHFELTIVGFVYTPRTIGARVKLTPFQLELWGQNDYEDRPTSCLSRFQRRRGDVLDFRDVSDEIRSYGDDDFFRPTSGMGSRAHVTLGVAPGSSAVVTGLDLIEILTCEEEDPFGGEESPVKGGVARYYGEGRVGVYLEQPIVVNSIFSGRY